MSAVQDDVMELLPFWVNGTLLPAERDEVAAALASSAELRAEVSRLEQLRARMQAVPQPQSPGELGLARLMRAIDAPSPAQAPRPEYLRIAASVVAAAAVSSALTYAVMREEAAVGADVIYEQASGDSSVALVVTFRPESTEAAISALLREKGLVIIDGPSAIGLYRLALPYDLNAEDARKYLLDASDVVASVEQDE